MELISRRIASAFTSLAPLIEFMTNSSYAQRVNDPDVSDFALGNPQEMPLEGFVNALQRWAVPQDKNWFAYKANEPSAQSAVAQALRDRLGLSFEAEDVFLTTGAFAALSVAIATFTNPGDEVIFSSPPWFFYEPMISAWSGKPVRVNIHPTTFDLDLDAIADAITPSTRAIIVNSPHNPTGKIYPAETLQALSQLLTDASARQGRPIYLFSDESYCRIVYDGRPCPSPTQFYPHTILLYTYGKTMLTPGQRMGYIALPPTMPVREPLRLGLFTAQTVVGWVFPNAIMQRALPELEQLSIDITALQRRRDRMHAALSEMGYNALLPEATFYLTVRSPLADDVAFCELLGEHDILCMPGAVFEMPGYFRISLTANDQMVERALPGFAAAIRQIAPAA